MEIERAEPSRPELTPDFRFRRIAVCWAMHLGLCSEPKIDARLVVLNV